MARLATPPFHGRLFRSAVRYTLGFLFALWLVAALQLALDSRLQYLGVLPRDAGGLVGVLTAPLVHGNLSHLLTNCLTLLPLGVAVFYFYDRVAVWSTVAIYLGHGLLVWVWGRDAWHLGASGLAYGLLSILFFQGLLRGHVFPLVISLMSLVLFGGMWAGVLPGQDPSISWESHAAGGVVGFITVVVSWRVPISSLMQEKLAEEQAQHDYLSSSQTSSDDHEKSTQLPQDFKYRF